GAGGSQDDLGRERDQFGRVFTHGVGLSVAPAVVDADVLPDSPARLRQALRECRQTGLCFGIIRGIRCEHADAAHPVWLLRPRRERPGGRADEQRDELATAQWIELHSVPAAKPDFSISNWQGSVSGSPRAWRPSLNVPPGASNTPLDTRYNASVP